MSPIEFVENARKYPLPEGMVDRCIESGIASDAADFGMLYAELLKFFWLGKNVYSENSSAPMFSERIDSVWHEWVLYTRNYAVACIDIFGEFMHHQPVSSKGIAIEKEVERMIEFIRNYELHFGPIPAIWNLDYYIRTKTMPKRICLDPVEQCDVPGRLHLSSSPS